MRNLTAERYPNENYSIVDVIEQECLSLAGCKPLTVGEKKLLGDALFKAAERREILLILDGFDELSEEIPPALLSVLHSFMSFEQTILTSRPYNLSELKEEYKFNSHYTYEITGFAEPHVKSYIHDFFQYLPDSQPKEAEQVLAFLEQNRNIAGLCRIPINLELFCSAWAKCKIPQGYYSITAIYEIVTRALCLRYLEREGQRKKIRDMDDALIREHCKSPLAFLEHFGYQSVSTNKLFLNVAPTCQYLRHHNQSLNDSNFLLEQKAFGFIRPTNSKNEYDGVSYYYFNHLTFRDYFAACFLMRCFQANSNSTSIDKQTNSFSRTGLFSDDMSLEEFLNKKRFEPRYEFIWWFMAGILAIQREVLPLKKLLFLFLTVDDKAEINRFLLLARCLDEASELNGELPQRLWDYIEAWFKYIFHPFFNLILLHNQSAIINTLKISPSIFLNYNVQSFFREEIPKSDIFELKKFIDFFCRIGLPLPESLDAVLLERVLRTRMTMNRIELRFWQALIQGLGVLYKRKCLSLSLLRQKYREIDALSEEGALMSAIFLNSETSPEDAIEPSLFKQQMYQCLVDKGKPLTQRIAAASMLGNYYELVVFLLLKQKEEDAHYLSWNMKHFFRWLPSQNVVNILTEPIAQKLKETPFVDFELRALLQRLKITPDFAPFFEPSIFKIDRTPGDRLIVFLCWVCSLKTAVTPHDLSNLQKILEAFKDLLIKPEMELEKERFSEFLAELFSPELLVLPTFIQVRDCFVNLFLSCFNDILAPTIKKYLALTLACYAVLPPEQCPMVFNTVICNHCSEAEFMKLSPKLLALESSSMLMVNELSFCRQDCTAFLDELILDGRTDSHSLFLLLNKTPTRAILKFAVDKMMDCNEEGFCHLMTTLILRCLSFGRAFYLNEEGICYFENHKYQVFSLHSEKRKSVERLIHVAKGKLSLPTLSQEVVRPLFSASVRMQGKEEEKKAFEEKAQDEEEKPPFSLNLYQMFDMGSKKATHISRSAVAFGANSSVHCNTGSGGKSVFHSTDERLRERAQVNLSIREKGNMAVGFSEVVKAIQAIKAVYVQYKKAERVAERFKTLLDNINVLESILEYPGLSNALYSGQVPQPLQRVFQRIDDVLRSKKHEDIQGLAQADGAIAKLKNFFTADGNFRKYEDFLADIDAAVGSLQLTLAIQGFVTDEASKKEKKEFQGWLRLLSKEIQEQLKAQEEGLKAVFDSVNREKPQDKQSFVDKVYGQCAVAQVADAVALKVSKTEVGDKEEIAALYDKLVGRAQDRDSSLEVFFKCAVASELNAIAVHMDSGLSQEDWDKSQNFAAFFSHNKQKIGDAPKEKEKEKEEKVEGISCEKTEKGEFRVNIHYSKLKLTPAEAQVIQNTLKGEQGEGAYAYISSSEPDRRGNITWLLFDDEEAASNLVEVLKADIAELKRSPSVQRGESPAPK